MNFFQQCHTPKKKTDYRYQHMSYTVFSVVKLHTNDIFGGVFCEFAFSLSELVMGGSSGDNFTVLDLLIYFMQFSKGNDFKIHRGDTFTTDFSFDLF